MSTCNVCHTEMYYVSNGFYECRNFDCPPGTAKRYQDSWALVKLWKPLLLQQDSTQFKVYELKILLQRHNSNDKDGPLMQSMAERLGLTIEDAKAAAPKETP